LLIGGALVNSLLAICQNLPGLQVVGAQIPWWLYQGEKSQSINRYESIIAGNYRRGYGLFQAATTLGGFLAIALMVCVFSGASIFKKRWFGLGAMVVVTIGILATYSRQAVVAIGVGAMGLALLANQSRGPVLKFMLAIVFVGVMAFSLDLVDSSLFYKRSELLVEYKDDEGLMSRLDRLSDFAEYSFRYPIRLLIGNGAGIADLRDRGLLSQEDLGPLVSGFVSNSFPLILFNFGLFGLIGYLGIIVIVITRGISKLSLRPTGSERLQMGLLAGLCVGVVLHAFDNYFAESFQMKSIFWLLLGLLACVLQDTQLMGYGAELNASLIRNGERR
jgi:hypothetical protein